MSKMVNAIKEIELDIKEIQKLTLELATPKNLAIVAVSLGVSYVGYKTLVIYLRRRKYRHIPGPPTKGFVSYMILL